MKNQNISNVRTLIFMSIMLLVLNACTSTKKAKQTHQTKQTKQTNQANRVNQTVNSSPVKLKSKNKYNDKLNLKLCKMSVSNPPATNNNRISRKSVFACVNNVKLLVAPASNSCLSSGFGMRHGSKHNGVDYQSKPAGNIVASGNGVIVKVDFRLKDYGHWIIIDHGKGIYTSYAHLESVNRNIKTGTKVFMGQTLGKMGRTGKATAAIHLHFEVRKGNYKNRKGWWGLSPIDLFKQKESC